MNWFDEHGYKHLSTYNILDPHYQGQIAIQKKKEHVWQKYPEEENRKSEELIKINLEKERLNRIKLLL